MRRLKPESFLAVVALLVPCSIAGQTTKRCVAGHELALAGVRLGASASQVREHLGSPLMATKDSSEDDGGVYPVLHMKYRDLNVDLGRGRVEHVSTTSTRPYMPSGAHVGMPLHRVMRLLHIGPSSIDMVGDTLSPHICADVPGEPVVALVLGPGAVDSLRVVKAISLDSFGP